MNTLEPYHQTYTYDTGNNLTTLSHQAKSSAWQQTISFHPNNNRGTETKPSITDFDSNGNLLILNNITTLDWNYNNTLNKLNKLTKDDKTTECYVYDHQGNRVRTVLESNQKSQRDYLPLLDISTNAKNQVTNTLHIGTHILAKITKDAVESCYQLSNHLQSNTLELNDKAEIISYEHFYPYGGTAIIAGKDQTQVQQKRYRYTGKERDDSSGLSYYGARYLAPWMARWISPDSAGAVDGLNLYVYAGNNPLKYIDPTGHVITIPTISWGSFTSASNAYMETHELNFWVGEDHSSIKGRQLLSKLDASIVNNRNIVIEATNAGSSGRPTPWSQETFSTAFFINNEYRLGYAQTLELTYSQAYLYQLTENRNGYFIGRNNWENIALEQENLKTKGMKGSSDFLVGAVHVLSHGLTFIDKQRSFDKKSTPIYWHFAPDSSIALVPKSVVNLLQDNPSMVVRDFMEEREYGVWVLGEDGSVENAALALGKEHVIKGIFSDLPEKIPKDFSDLKNPNLVTTLFLPPSHRQPRNRRDTF